MVATEPKGFDPIQRKALEWAQENSAIANSTLCDFSHAYQTSVLQTGGGDPHSMREERSLIRYATNFVGVQMKRTDFSDSMDPSVDTPEFNLDQFRAVMSGKDWRKLTKVLLAHSFGNDAALRGLNMAKYVQLDLALCRGETPVVEGAERSSLRRFNDGSIEQVDYFIGERKLTRCYPNGSSSEASLDKRGLVTGTQYKDGGGNGLRITGKMSSHYTIENPLGYCVVDIRSGEVLELGNCHGDFRKKAAMRIDGVSYVRANHNDWAIEPR